ncbi:hypothetical protein WJ970_33540 [Achromobacter xylosoxidans]
METLSYTSGIFFDHDGDGFAEETGWVGKDDGLLVWDRNGNGQIDDGSELFGNNAYLPGGGSRVRRVCGAGAVRQQRRRQNRRQRRTLP